MSAPRSAIEVSGLRYQYRGSTSEALRELDLIIDEGQFTVIMGRSGAGKSTLCYCFNGLIPHFLRGQMQGRVRVFGLDTREHRVAELARLVGLVFQDFEAQLFSTNVELEVAFGPENFGLPLEEIRRRVKESLRAVKLEGCERRQPAYLSGGQKQRLAIASILAIRPQLLVMDEPTTDLDPIGKMEVFEVADQLRLSEEGTVVIVEHETEEALKGDQVAVMMDGQIIAMGRPEKVLTDVNLLERAGVMPPQTAHLFHTLGSPLRPLTVEDAMAALAVEQLSVDSKRYTRLSNGPSRGYGSTIIEVQDVEFSYPGGIPALSGVSLQIKQGEFVAILGQNGSGKTTLVKHFNGLLRPSRGTVLVKGLNTQTTSMYQLGRIVGYVFQNPDHQIFAQTVFDEVAFGPRLYGLSSEEVGTRVREALEAVDLVHKEAADPFLLTKGERQRVAVASILAAKPEVIVLDEPTTGLDYLELKGMMELTRHLNEMGHTVIIVTHSMWVAAQYAHRIVVMNNGRIIADGPTREVFAREDVLSKAFLKPPPIVRLSNRLGRTLLSVEEAAQVLVRSGSRGHISVSGRGDDSP